MTSPGSTKVTITRTIVDYHHIRGSLGKPHLFPLCDDDLRLFMRRRSLYKFPNIGKSWTACYTKEHRIPKKQCSRNAVIEVMGSAASSTFSASDDAAI